MVTYNINPAKTALMVIDMMESYFKPSSPLYCAAALNIIPNLKKLIDVCRAKNIPIIYTITAWRRDGLNAGRIVDFQPNACSEQSLGEGSEGLRIRQDIKPLEHEIVIKKPRFNAFHGTELELILHGLGTETLIITGVVTEVCCEHTARDAMQRDFKVIFVSDGNASRSEPQHKASLTVIGRVYAEIIDAGRLADRILGSI